MNPLWHQKKLREFCEEKGIHITAYSPLGARGTLWGTDWVMESDVLKSIARAKGKSVAQVNSIKLSCSNFSIYFLQFQKVRTTKKGVENYVLIYRKLFRSD